MKRCAKCNALVEDQYELCFRCGSVDFVSAEAAPAAAPSADQTAPAAPTAAKTESAAPTAAETAPAAPPAPKAAPPVPPAAPPTAPASQAAPSVPVETFTPPASAAAPAAQEAPKPPKKKKKIGLVIAIICGVIALAIVLVIIFGGSKTKTYPTDLAKIPAASEDSGSSVIGSSPVVFKYIGDMEKEGSMLFGSDLYTLDEDSRWQICDPIGVLHLQESYDYYHCEDTLRQMFRVKSNTASAPNNVGLVCSDGTVHIPCSAADIMRLNSRFYCVEYADREVSEDSGEAVVSLYDSDFNRHFYTGYAIVYDVVAQKFLEDTKVSDPGSRIDESGGNYFYVSDGKGKTVIYDFEGKKQPLLKDVEYNFWSGYAYKRDQSPSGTSTTVYDLSGKQISVVPKEVTDVFDFKYCEVIEEAGDDYLYYICDMNGKKVCETGFSAVSRFADPLFKCSYKKDGKTVDCIVSTDGTILYEDKAYYIDLNDICDGYARIAPVKGSHALLYPDGTYMDFEGAYFDHACQYYERGDGTTDVFIYAKKGKVNYPFKHVAGISKFLLRVATADDKYGLMDVFTGEMLLEPVYDKLEYVDETDCIYAHDADGKWKVYAVHENAFGEAKKVQKSILNALTDAFYTAGIDARIDEERGQVMLDSGVLFANDKSNLTAEGKAYLQKFIKVYTSVVLDSRYSGYVDSVVVKGHTDTNGTREHNLDLSQARADNVLAYTLTPECGGEDLRDIATAVGVAYDDPIYNADGSVNMAASRRVSFEIVVVTDVRAEKDGGGK